MPKTSRVVDPNGYMTVRGCPVSSWGIFDYGAGQIGLDGDPMRIVKVLRPESAINNASAIASFKTLPLIDDHEFLSGDDTSVTAPEDYGVQGVMTENVWYDAPWLRADLKIFSRSLREAIDAGKCELSLGYECDYILQPGTLDGEPYEVIQTNMRGNHIALVDAARVPGAKVLDGKAFDYMKFDVIPSKKETTMKLKKGKGADSDAMALLRQLVPALQQYVAANSTEAAPGDQGAEAGLGESQSVPDEDEEGEQPPMTTPGDNGVEAPVQATPAEGTPAEGAPAVAAPAEGGEGELVTILKQVITALKGGAVGADEVEGGEGVALDADKGVTLDGNEPEGKVSEGPTEGKHIGDAAMIRQEIYKDMSERDSLYKRVSPIIGAFDCSTMSAVDLAAYSAKKLGLKVEAKHARPALDAYLMGVKRQAPVAPVSLKAADAAECSAIAQFLKEAN